MYLSRLDSISIFFESLFVLVIKFIPDTKSLVAEMLLIWAAALLIERICPFCIKDFSLSDDMKLSISLILFLSEKFEFFAVSIIKSCIFFSFSSSDLDVIFNPKAWVDWFSSGMSVKLAEIPPVTADCIFWTSS